MKNSIILIFCSLVVAATCWEFPGHPGTNCPETLEIMLEDPERRWMLPSCKNDGAFESMQCYPGTNVCMCVAPDGAPVTLPGFVNVTACDCLLDQYVYYKHVNEMPEWPQCGNDGTYKPLQCIQSAGLCWCVDKRGRVISKPSKETKTC